MSTTFPAVVPATVMVPPNATFDVTRTPEGTPVVTFFTHDGHPAVELRAADDEAARALCQSAGAVATAMGVMVP